MRRSDKPEELDGMNAYNMHIFSERYIELIDRTIDIPTHYVDVGSFFEIYYLPGRGCDLGRHS
jgi:hypothetical protein